MSRVEKIIVWGATVVVAASGFVYAGMKYLLQPADEWAVVNHPLQPFVLKLHILAAPVLVFGIGLITARHILPHLRARVARARVSGTTTALVVIPMVLTGYLLQAVNSTTALNVLGYIHLATGFSFALSSIGHAIAIRRRARLTRASTNTEKTAVPLKRRAS